MMELSRSVALGQYVNSGSVLHRLDPRIKVLGLVALIVVISLASTFTALGALALFGLLALALSRISPRFIAQSLRPAIIFLVVIYVFQVLFYQPAVSHPHTLWSWGPLSVTVEGLLTSALINLRALLLYYFVNLLTFTTSLVDVADGVESLLSPLQRIGLPVNEASMVMVVALKFVPIFISELERLIKARAARGVKIDSGNFITRALNIGPLLIPLILGGFKRAEALTIAMEARGYRGGRGRTKLRRLRFGFRDVIAFIVLCGVCAAATYANIHAPL
jgi:energy-coupling factor transport system permease protein